MYDHYFFFINFGSFEISANVVTIACKKSSNVLFSQLSGLLIKSFYNNPRNRTKLCLSVIFRSYSGLLINSMIFIFYQAPVLFLLLRLFQLIYLLKMNSIRQNSPYGCKCFVLYISDLEFLYTHF